MSTPHPMPATNHALGMGIDQTTIVGQIEGFAIFALIMLLLGSFEQTHKIAVFIIGIVALTIVIKFASGSYK
jgi:uncharacterized membrane protein YuzA (DUF378 family)